MSKRSGPDPRTVAGGICQGDGCCYYSEFYGGVVTCAPHRATPKLLKALEETATERHKDAYPINNLHALVFNDCREARCTQARTVIEEARK